MRYTIMFSDNGYLGSLFLDISGPHDAVNPLFLKEKMQGLKIHLHGSKLIVQMFYNRKMYIRGKNNTLLGPRVITAGIPQGFVLSPLFFNINTALLHIPDVRTHLEHIS